MEKDHGRNSRWFDVLHGQAFQGLPVNQDDESRVYVVTVDTTAKYHRIHDRWPRLVAFNKEMNAV